MGTCQVRRWCLSCRRCSHPLTPRPPTMPQTHHLGDWLTLRRDLFLGCRCRARNHLIKGVFCRRDLILAWRSMSIEQSSDKKCGPVFRWFDTLLRVPIMLHWLLSRFCSSNSTSQSCCKCTLKFQLKTLQQYYPLVSLLMFIFNQF